MVERRDVLSWLRDDDDDDDDMGESHNEYQQNTKLNKFTNISNAAVFNRLIF